MLVAVGFFALMDAVLKTLAARYPVMQIAALRGLTCLPLVLAWITWRGAWGRVKPARWSLHLLRGALSVAMLSLFTLGVRDLPLSAAYTLFFIAPLLITALSVPVLKERVPPAHWWAMAAGVVGVLKAGSSKRTIGLRADMDALPLQELNQFEHRSTNDGKMHITRGSERRIGSCRASVSACRRRFSRASLAS